MLNAASKQVKKIRLFAYRPIISLASIIIGGCILFDAKQNRSNNSTIIGLLYVSAGSFILFFMILAIRFSLTQFRQFKMPKLESKNGSKYTPLISDVWYGLLLQIGRILMFTVILKNKINVDYFVVLFTKWKIKSLYGVWILNGSFIRSIW